MTTIAYRDGVLAADSRVSCDAAFSDRYTKIVRVNSKVDPIKGSILVACSGAWFSSRLFIDWLEGGAEPKLHARGADSEQDFEAVIVHKKGLFSANYLCRIDPNPHPYWAAGSGGPYAMAAMWCGKSAAEAVRCAIAMDSHSGGRVLTMTLDHPAQKRATKR